MLSSSNLHDLFRGIPDELPPAPRVDPAISRAPKRSITLSPAEKTLAVNNALRYVPEHHREILIPEIETELEEWGHIYLFRYRPDFTLKAIAVEQIPANSAECACIIQMILNNLDPEVAQHPYELITYGGNGAVFQNWAQFRLTLHYLSTMSEDDTLALASGHPVGVFPAFKDSSRVILTNGLTISGDTSTTNYNNLSASGVTNYGQMTAGSFMYIGPQGIVHGTTITFLNAIRRIKKQEGGKTVTIVTSGLGGMSGAQAKAGKIVGARTIIAEVDQLALEKRLKQGWLDRIISTREELIELFSAPASREPANVGQSIGFLGNIVDLWQHLAELNIHVDIGTDQTSLHNPFGGGYYPNRMNISEARQLLQVNPQQFKSEVHRTLREHVQIINTFVARGTYFFDYGNAFLVEARNADADILNQDGSFRYRSYVEDSMGPLCFDYGFGPFRWVCCSLDPEDLRKSDVIATEVLRGYQRHAATAIKNQLEDNLHWIKTAQENKLVVGSQARILYADAHGRVSIAKALNEAIAKGRIKGPIVLGRDHHDVSGTDSPYRETSDIRDGSNVCADMSVLTMMGNATRGATWVSLHNGGGVGWGKAINGGFGLVLDGSASAAEKAERLLNWDVLNGVARRSWAGHAGARETIRNLPAAGAKSTRITVPEQSS